MKKFLIPIGAVGLLALIVWASLRDTGPRGTEVNVQAAARRTVSSRVKATGEITPEKKVEITDGLDDGSEVVVGPYRTLKNLHAGDRVTPGATEDEAEHEEGLGGELQIEIG